ncbi:MAG: MFS transporter [Opitutales bacterium]|jgi:nitrate/nitrite transporter NarK|nr:MFS transporter [Opitutales bacterium]
MPEASDSPEGFSFWRRFSIMIALVISGELVFILPFVLVRIFRPTYLDVFGLTNAELGTAFSLLGIVAMIAYVPGGIIADRFSARRLMSLALIITGAGGLYLRTIPSIMELRLLYTFWGVSTMLLFWAAMLRATRECGGDRSQGRAFGFLDGGRGLTAASFASGSVIIFSMLLPSDAGLANLEERTAALKQIISIFTHMVLLAALLVWVLVPDRIASVADGLNNRLSLEGIRKVLPMPTLWLLSLIVVSAYVGMKSVAFFSQYASDVFGYDDVAAAHLGTVSFWVRPFAAIGAGFLGDRFGNSRLIVLSFIVVALGGLIFASNVLAAGIYWSIVGTVIFTSIGIYALRGIYFSLFQEAKMPMVYTGSAIGLISVIGYSPDIFSAYVFGLLIDSFPGALGYQYVFGLVSVFALVGLVATVCFQRLVKSKLDRGLS